MADKTDTPLLPLVRNHTYEAKRPARTGLISDPLINDRMIVWISHDGGTVQYDGPAVKIGRRLPKVSAEAFRAWAARDVTELMPLNEWRRWPAKEED